MSAFRRCRCLNSSRPEARIAAVITRADLHGTFPKFELWHFAQNVNARAYFLDLKTYN